MRYFSLEVRGVPFNRSKPSMFSFIPHGVFPFSLALPVFSPMNDFFNKLRPVVANVTLKMPVFGHVVRGAGALEADVAKIDQALRCHALSLPPLVFRDVCVGIVFIGGGTLWGSTQEG